MSVKTKSILIGLASSFVAVMMIVIIFFSLTDLSGRSGKKVEADDPNASNSSVVSDGKTVEQGGKKQDGKTDTSSEEEDEPVSSQEIVEATGAFGRADIDGITQGLNTFAKLVKAVDPVSFEWSASSMAATGEVNVKLIARDGSYAVIGVPYESADYTVGGEVHGIGIDVTDWEVYETSRKKESRVREIVWLSNDMQFNQPRGVKIGTPYAEIAPAYLKIENPDKTYLLYEASDVISDEGKLKKYKNASGAYIGGKIYKTTTLLNSVYPDDPDAYPFANNSKNVIRYGFNSIVDTDETGGQWYIEYATMNSKVMGIYFHMTGADD